MSREESAEGEVGGRAREWVGGRIHFSSRPTRQILIMILFPMFESSLNLLSPRFFCALVFYAESLHYNSECSVLFLFQISYDCNSTQRFQLH